MTRFDTSVLQPNPARRRPILAVLDAALDAVDPYAAVQHVLQRRGDILTVADPSIRESENAPTYDLHRFRRISSSARARPPHRCAAPSQTCSVTASARVWR